ncbi:hypothetical protein VYH97_10295 [Streptococcus anginosus]|nr:hypothetical protein [Streptococcus anginosus]MED5843851.1 hypothetical protein [Streptococcus anginosus]MED5870940.1 hypothetical protein [Streptococcus anginosus]MED5900430.1 hypothetical protein [Streptococcus anginosus]MED5909939.1 hypothetical protein [Streptococcus anginosus]
MINKCLKAVVLFLMLISLSGCHKLDKGIVIDKYIDHSYVAYIYTGKVMVPVFYPEKYLIKIKGKIDKKEIKETFSLKKSEWENIKIGDVYEVRDD